MHRVLTAALMSMAAAAGTAAAEATHVPEGYQQILGEMQIGADVLRAALAEAWPGARRVVDVEAGYLAGQGALVIVDVASPWFRRGGGELDLDPDITSLDQIPDMVQGILRQLDVGLSRQQAQELNELRQLRDSRREAQARQRAVRAELREKRRLLERSDDTQATRALRQQVDALEAELATAENDERSVARKVTAARDSLNRPPPAPADSRSEHSDGEIDGEIDRVVTQAMCSYGSTFKSLQDDEQLNVLVRRDSGSRYYVFQMGRVRACQNGALTPEALLSESFSYRS